MEKLVSQSQDVGRDVFPDINDSISAISVVLTTAPVDSLRENCFCHRTFTMWKHWERKHIELLSRLSVKDKHC